MATAVISRHGSHRIFAVTFLVARTTSLLSSDSLARTHGLLSSPRVARTTQMMLSPSMARTSLVPSSRRMARTWQLLSSRGMARTGFLLSHFSWLAQRPCCHLPTWLARRPSVRHAPVLQSLLGPTMGSHAWFLLQRGGQRYRCWSYGTLRRRSPSGLFRANCPYSKQVVVNYLPTAHAPQISPHFTTHNAHNIRVCQGKKFPLDFSCPPP